MLTNVLKENHPSQHPWYIRDLLGESGSWGLRGRRHSCSASACSSRTLLSARTQVEDTLRCQLSSNPYVLTVWNWQGLNEHIDHLLEKVCLFLAVQIGKLSSLVGCSTPSREIRIILWFKFISMKVSCIMDDGWQEMYIQPFYTIFPVGEGDQTVAKPPILVKSERPKPLLLTCSPDGLLKKEGSSCSLQVILCPSMH